MARFGLAYLASVTGVPDRYPGLVIEAAQPEAAAPTPPSARAGKPRSNPLPAVRVGAANTQDPLIDILLIIDNLGSTVGIMRRGAVAGTAIHARRLHPERSRR